MAVGIGDVVAGSAFLVSLYALYLTHLKGADITLSTENGEAMIDELEENDFVTDIPTRLRGNISFFLLNQGNRTGAIKFIDLKFQPDKNVAEF